MSVPEVVAAYEALRPIIKHFELSTKSKEQLDACIKILNLRQIHLISWSGTRMAHFVSACSQFVKLLPAVYDTMYSTNIKKEERDTLFKVENIFTIVLLSDLTPFFKENFLRSMDKDILLISTVVGTASEIALKFQGVETPEADKFIDRLNLDAMGNLNGKVKIQGEEHTMRLVA